MCGALGSYKTWKEMLDELGNFQERLTKNCCMDNLQKDATEERGDFHTHNCRIGITASGGAGWQGGGFCVTYNSISDHKLLIGGYTKLVIAFKFIFYFYNLQQFLFKKRKL